MKRLKIWAFVLLLLITYTLCPIKQTYASELDTSGEQNTESEEVQGEEGAETADNTALIDNAGIEISAPSAILMEASTGTIIYEKNSKEQLRPASITKIMTLIIIFDALEAGKITLEDTVTVSEYAASMGGSQVFLEPGETQTVDTMIKCIAVASANDACVAMAEYIYGSESEFVNQMNERAKGLGMENTHFVNCNGLDVDGHMTSAYDVALMSRELIVKYPQIHNYSTIWMENITHVTKKGSTEFGLTNTNKLIKQYEYATGLKTGSTSLAKYCVSATAVKNDIELIAVIMAAPDYKVRFQDATTLLNFGYGKCQVYSDDNQEPLPQIAVKKGIERSVNCEYEDNFKYLDVTGADLTSVEKEMQLPESVEAPINAGDMAGKIVYTLGGKEIGYTKILYTASVDEAAYMDYFLRTLKLFVL
ncbi:D-alanyl-D-alanine carboxypeptidase family protein [Konateibacter massiliensis]|uniref:D-alanyl-D-alanine carboxypeptidase family protein n=1 Tax=Konateibacter massiliensis TaxID=2002841 RepID=UPI000C157889|nr:D-alanyl-D-alanine carboxypeptidase family protein [Konateibacter massiliensis]